MPWTKGFPEDETCPLRDATGYEIDKKFREPGDIIPTQSMPSDFWPINSFTSLNLANWNTKSHFLLTEANLKSLDFQHVLPIHRLVHCTHELQASQITQPDGGAMIKGFKFSTDNYRHLCAHGDGLWTGSEPSDHNGLAALGKLVWFGVELDSDVNNHIRDNVRKTHEAAGSAISDHHLAQLATSPLFSGVSRYGNFAFSASVQDFTNVVESAFACEENGSGSKSDDNGSPAKRPKPDTSACFHSGGTLLYQREVAYVVIVTPKSKCKTLTESGFPCLGENSSLFYKAIPSETPPDHNGKGPVSSNHTKPSVESFFKDDQVPMKLAERGGRTTAELRIRGTAGDSLDLKDEKKGFVPIYWEHVIFAVQADKLEFPPGKVQTKLVDHNISCCQPSSKLGQEDRVSSLRYPQRMNCHFGGYATAKRLKETLEKRNIVLQKLLVEKVDPWLFCAV